MAAYIHGVIDSNNRLEDPMAGLEGAPVCNLPYRDLGVVISELGERIRHITEGHVLGHERVAERLMEHFTVLPFRFPTIFDTKEDVLAMMNDRYDDFRDNLKRLRGKAEFGIKVIWPGAEIRARMMPVKNCAPLPAPASPARSYIKKKLEEHRIESKIEDEAEKRIALVDGFFDEFATEKKLEKRKTNDLLLAALYLVDKDKQGGFTQAFERLRSAPGELKYLFSGPWPPYNFIKMARCAISP